MMWMGGILGSFGAASGKREGFNTHFTLLGLEIR